jgi:hypothetical protein
MDETLRIEGRYCGPPGCANGGYVAGLVSRAHAGPITITFRRPVRLDAGLRLVHDVGGSRIVDGDDVVVEATDAMLDLVAPFHPTFEQADIATRAYLGHARHPFPGCFVCGTARVAGDGLRVFAGPVEGMHCVASPWVPDAELADSNGIIPGEIAWAALDCPGGFAIYLDVEPRPAVLGRMTGHVTGRVHADEPCVVIGWPIAHDGRKHHVGSALFDSRGNACGVAHATWIEVEARFSGT